MPRSLLLIALLAAACASAPQPTRDTPFPSPTLVERSIPALSTPLLTQGFPFQCSPTLGCEAVFPVRGEDEAEVAYLDSGQASLGMRLALLEGARRSIRVQALIFHGDESGIAIAHLLKEKRAEGLDVRVIVDSVSNLDWQSQWLYYDLQRHGVPVQGYEALGFQLYNELDTEDVAYVNKRYHEKLFIVDAGTDDAQAILGGLNIGNEYFGVDPTPSEQWRDQDILLRGGPLIDDLALAFDRTFDHLEAHKPLPTTDAWRVWQLIEQEHIPIGFVQKRPLVDAVQRVRDDYATLEPRFYPTRARFLHSRPREEETYILQAYVELIRSARHEILIQNAYFVPTRPVREALRDAAARGVTVHLVTNSKEANDLPALTNAGRYYYIELMGGNDPSLEVPPLRVFEWEGYHFGKGTLHSKFAVFDRSVAVVGSYNLDPRSQNLNSESALVFDAPHVIDRLTEDFYRDLQYSREITPAEAALYNEPDDLLLKWEMDLSRSVEEHL